MPKKRSRSDEFLNNVVVVSDTHCGCRLGLLPLEGTKVDEGNQFGPSRIQEALFGHWQEFWGEFVPDATRKEPFAVVHNGDCIDGVHHGSVHQMSHNLQDQANIAHELMKPVVDLCDGRYFHIRGTEAHVGKSGQEEERLAQRLNSIPNEDGQHARWELWLEIGQGLLHLMHHIGTTGSQAYEATAVHKELNESYVESARFGERPPDCIVRSHRHRYLQTGIATERGNGFAVVTPGWQGKTPFAWKVAGARLSQPQFGGVVIRFAHNRLFCDAKVWVPGRSKSERLTCEARSP